MSDANSNDTVGDADPDIEAVQRDIEQTRERLAETVDQLQAKFDVKARATAGAQDAKQRALTKVVDSEGRPRPAALTAAGAVVAGVLAVVAVKMWRRRSRGI